MKPCGWGGHVFSFSFAKIFTTVRDANIFQGETNSGIISDVEVAAILFTQAQLIQRKYNQNLSFNNLAS
jgi:hypothetical protein